METMILRDLDFQIKSLCVLDLFNIAVFCEGRQGEGNALAVSKIQKRLFKCPEGFFGRSIESLFLSF